MLLAWIGVVGLI